MAITQDPARLSAVAGALREAARKIDSGQRVRLPVIKTADAAGISFAMMAEFDAAITERTAHIARDNFVLACHKGCNSCCYPPVVVSESEAVMVAEWLSLPANAEVRARFLANLPQWRRAVGDASAAVIAAKTAEERRTTAITYTRKEALCAFNHEGACSIYPARPARCRMAHALVDNTHCAPWSDGQINYYTHHRTQITFEEQEDMRGVMHAAMRHDAPYEHLSNAVDRLLGASASIGRNDPCPCGSGKKYKRCCG